MKNNLTLLILTLIMLVSPLSNATTPATQTLDYAQDPLLEDAPEPISDAELGGIGCLIASTAVSGSMLYLMGGISTALSSMAPPIPPSMVLEGSAAVAFVLSSACYIGVALAPIAVGAYNSVADKFVQQETPPRPLFGPGELGAIANGMMPPEPPAAVATPQPQPGMLVPVQ